MAESRVENRQCEGEREVTVSLGSAGEDQLL